MGTIIGTGDGDTVTWTTYDFAGGGDKGSAWAPMDHDCRHWEKVHITGYLEWDNRNNRIVIKADLPCRNSGTYNAEVLLYAGNRSVPRQKGLLTMELSAFQRDAATENQGDFKAQLEGTLCSVQTPIECFTAEFIVDTRIQFGY